MSKEDLEKARSDAEYILTLADKDVAELFYRETMRRSLSRTVRRLDKLILSGEADRKLGERALARLGFAPAG